MEILFFWIVLGAIVAMVAKSKGQNPVAWFFYGLLIFPIAIVHALLLRQEPGTTPGLGRPPEPPRTVPFIHQSPNGRPTGPYIHPAMPTQQMPPAAPSTGPASEPLDTETLRVAAEWRAAGREFNMIDAKEEARLRLMDRATAADPSALSERRG